MIICFKGNNLIRVSPILAKSLATKFLAVFPNKLYRYCKENRTFAIILQKTKTNIWVLSINILIFALLNGVTISKHIELAFAFRNVCFGQPKCGNVLLIFRKGFYFYMRILEILINLRHT